MSASAETSRRALLLGAAAGAATLVAHALGRPALVKAEGQPIVVGGEYTNATSQTLISNQANNEDVFSAVSFGSGTGSYGYSNSKYGVWGESSSGTGVIGSSGFGDGVRGFSNNAAGGHFEGGPGVAGISSTGYGGFFNGAVAQIRILPKSTAGKPTSGGHLKGEIYMDSKGSLFVCSAGGTPGTWRKVTTKLA